VLPASRGAARRKGLALVENEALLRDEDMEPKWMELDGKDASHSAARAGWGGAGNSLQSSLPTFCNFGFSFSESRDFTPVARPRSTMGLSPQGPRASPDVQESCRVPGGGSPKGTAFHVLDRKDQHPAASPPST